MNRSEKWMYQHARPIDLARWQYHFEDGTAADVVKILKTYQNTDGGFAHALEADCWNPVSSPIQTWAATEILREIKCDDSDVIESILLYLDSGESFKNKRWLNTISSNNDYPHATWWTHNQEADYNKQFNPSAALAGFCIKYADVGSPLFQKAQSIVAEAVSFFTTTESLVEMHELACFMRLFDYLQEAKQEPFVDTKAFEDKLIEQVNQSLERDASKWLNNYICKPSQLFTNKENICYKGNEAVVAIELNFINETRNKDGVWDIPWAWSAYEKEFAVSKLWWQGDLVVKYHLMLRNFS